MSPPLAPVIKLTSQDSTVALTVKNTFQGQLVDLSVVGGGGNVPANTFSAYNIKHLGAFGDNASHPLSSVYGSLAAAKVVYPSAASLNEEIDFNCVRRAIELASVGTLAGGNVYIPTGRYKMNNALSVGANIQLPACNLSGRSGIQINIIGDGAEASELIWPVDATDSTGRGLVFAMSCGPQASTFTTPLSGGRYSNTQFYGWIKNLGLIGPNQAVVRGTVNCNMSGLGWGARRFLEGVHIAGFYAGLDIVGDWTSFKDCIFENCFYDAYFPWKSSTLYGDLIFEKCSFGNACRADIAIGTRGYMGAKFDGCFIGSAPYAFVYEAATQGTTPDGNTHVTSTQFEKCLFENLGNSFIGDDNANVNVPGATGVRNFKWQQVDFNSCYWSWNSSNRDTTQSRNGDYAIVANTLKTFSNRGFTNFIPGDVGLLQIDSVLGWEEYCDLTALFSALNGGKQFFDPAIGVNGTTTFRWKDSLTSDRGSIWRANAGNVGQYDVLEFTGNRAVESTASTLPVVGTAKHAQATANGYIMVCFGGHRAVVNALETPPTANTWIKKGASGRAQAATGPTDGQVIGYASSVNTVATPNQYNFLWASGAVIGD